MSPRRVALVVSIALVGVAGLARAEDRLLPQAEELLRRANLEPTAQARFRLADQARALCEQAIARSPRDPLGHLFLSRALSVSDPAHPEACRPGTCEQAARELDRAQALDASGELAQTIAFERGIVFSRLRRHADALAEYQRALHLTDPERLANVWDASDARALLYYNSAETLMALGRLDEAIARYRRARDLTDPASFPDWELEEWGLGVALDRDGQVTEANEAIRRALTMDPTMESLEQPEVFFEPPGSIHYYRALGHEVAGDRALAIAAWRSYLAASPPPDGARRARAHLAALAHQPPGLDASHLDVEIDEPQTFAGQRSAADLAAALRAHVDDLQLCYARALRTAPKLHGWLRLVMDIGPFGRVYGRARIFDDDLGDAAQPLRSCVELAASTWRFSQVAGLQPESVMVRYRLSLRP